MMKLKIDSEVGPSLMCLKEFKLKQRRRWLLLYITLIILTNYLNNKKITYFNIRLWINLKVAIKVINKSKLKKFGEGIMDAIGNEVNILQEISNLQEK